MRRDVPRVRLGRADAVALAVIAATAVGGLLVLPRLPAAVAIHVSATGRSGNEVPRTVAVVAGPAATLATLAAMRLVARVDPPSDERGFDALVVSTTLLLAVVHALLLGVNLGYGVPVAAFGLAVAGWVVVVAGYVVREASA